MNKLSKYLLDNNVDILNEDIIVKFVKDIYNFDYYNPTDNNQLNKIKNLKNLLEFKDTGNYCESEYVIVIILFWQTISSGGLFFKKN